MYAVTLFGCTAQKAHVAAIAIPQVSAKDKMNSGGLTYAALSALRSYSSQGATKSATSQRRSVTPAAIAGLMRSVR